MLIVGIALFAGVAVSAIRSTSHSGPDDQTANSAAREELLRSGVDPSSELPYTHYLYFSNKSDSDAVAATLTAEFTVDVRPPGGGIDDWAVVARQTIALDAPALDRLTAQFTDVAERSNGTYDGWEVELKP